MAISSQDQQRISDQRHKDHLPYPMMHSCETIEPMHLLEPRRQAHDQKLSKGRRSEQQTGTLPRSEQDARPAARLTRVRPTRDAYRRMSCSQQGQRAQVGYPRADKS